MKNAFYFTLKALIVLKSFKFALTFRSYKKQLDQKDQFNFQIYDVTNWETIAIHILLYISRSKGNQTMKIGHRNFAKLIRKHRWHRCFPVNFAKFLRTPFFIENLWQLFLQIEEYEIPFYTFISDDKDTKELIQNDGYGKYNFMFVILFCRETIKRLSR